MPILEEIRQSIERGRSKDTERLIQAALEQGISPDQILNEGMVPAMQNVGEEYKQNRVDLPGIMLAARGMRKGMDLLESRMEKGEIHYVGKVILGTVEGDLHDVGKNLVAIMFRSAGFQVVDLGVDVSERQFIRALKEHPDVSIVCVSSLLSTSRQEMRHVVKSIRRMDKKKQLKIMVGGGSVNQEFAREIGADGYTDNAVEAAEMARTFIV